MPIRQVHAAQSALATGLHLPRPGCGHLPELRFRVSSPRVEPHFLRVVLRSGQFFGTLPSHETDLPTPAVRGQTSQGLEKSMAAALAASESDAVVDFLWFQV